MAKKLKKLTPLMVRMPTELHQRIAKSAKDRDHSLNSEIAYRLEQSFTWGDARDRATQLLQDAEQALAKSLDAHLRAKGFTPVATPKGRVWLSPGMDPLKVAIWTDPTAFQEAQEKAIRNIFREIVRGKE